MTRTVNGTGQLDGLYHQQTEGNEHKRESCLVEFFSRPPSAGRRLQFRRLDHFHLLHCCCAAAASASTASTSCADARRWRLAQIRPDCSCRLNSSIPVFLALFSRVSRAQLFNTVYWRRVLAQSTKKARSRGKCRAAKRLKNP